MVYRPGSHLVLAKYREENPELKGVAPCIKGTPFSEMPELDFSEPIPLTAKAGQVSILTTSVIHGGSVNVDDEPRKVLVIAFVPKTREIGLPQNQAEQKRIYDTELKTHLRPERRHIVAAT